MTSESTSKSCVGAVDAVDDRLKLLDETFFERLERESKKTWKPEARERLVAVIETYLRLALNLPKTHKPSDRARSKVQLAAKRLRNALSTYPDRDFACLSFMAGYGLAPEQGTDIVTAPQRNVSRLLGGLKCMETLPRRGLPPKARLQFLVFEVARIYRFVGGSVTISPDGPFAKVLMLIYELLPKTTGFPKSPDALVRFAEERRSEIQDHVRRHPLT
jgi:hypothetical protein